MSSSEMRKIMNLVESARISLSENDPIMQGSLNGKRIIVGDDYVTLSNPEIDYSPDNSPYISYDVDFDYQDILDKVDSYKSYLSNDDINEILGGLIRAEAGDDVSVAYYPEEKVWYIDDVVFGESFTLEEKDLRKILSHVISGISTKFEKEMEEILTPEDPGTYDNHPSLTAAERNR